MRPCNMESIPLASLALAVISGDEYQYAAALLLGIRHFTMGGPLSRSYGPSTAENGSS